MPSDLQAAATPVRLLAISGSLRAASHCTALLRHVGTMLPAGVMQQLLTLGQVPPYDGDLDCATPPAAVAELKEAIARADGLVICSPEYNYGIPVACSRTRSTGRHGPASPRH
ncbi:FMN reductase [Variovorax sp. PBS-H4]|uniref:NADPH-dependent FMN reductase n=1 Tax=Variovorax sp. PBS-H4 TaxID=434008 RepID=UPI001318D686|nr:NADPH-dependent FMN reductase [Variovorax sp. PBS-H4]VTU39115.1 FMN reductase [Variovorax sp. PBS-H4]